MNNLLLLYFFGDATGLLDTIKFNQFRKERWRNLLFEHIGQPVYWKRVENWVYIFNKLANEQLS
jgi:hypothetical protein